MLRLQTLSVSTVSCCRLSGPASPNAGDPVALDGKPVLLCMGRTRGSPGFPLAILPQSNPGMSLPAESLTLPLPVTALARSPVKSDGCSSLKTRHCRDYQKQKPDIKRRGLHKSIHFLLNHQRKTPPSSQRSSEVLGVGAGYEQTGGRHEFKDGSRQADSTVNK